MPKNLKSWFASDTVKTLIWRIRPFRRYLFDLRDDFRRLLVRPTHLAAPAIGLSARQIYPMGRAFDSLIYDYLETSFPWKIRKSDPISSIGSCFAEEFARYMIDRGHNFQEREKSFLRESANWGRVYSTVNLRQVVEYSFDPSFPVLVEQDAKGWFDPLRAAAGGFHPNEMSLRDDIRRHRAHSSDAFTESAFLVITLGQNETWWDSQHQVAWAVRPTPQVRQSQPSRFAIRKLRYEENVAFLRRTLQLLWERNPRLRIVITLSPVHSAATYLGSDVLMSSTANKSILRAAIDEVLPEHPDKLAYYPSYEMVMAYNPANFLYDNRHVNQRTKRRILKGLDLISGPT